MRRALKILLLAVAVLLVACGLTGALVLQHHRAQIGDDPGQGHAMGGIELAHAVAGHLLTVAACLVAAIAFLLGLQGLLETGGRRLPSALLFLLAPLLMGVALAADFSGQVDWDQPGGTFQSTQLEEVVPLHVSLLAGMLAGCAAATAAVAGWLRWKGGQDEQDEET